MTGIVTYASLTALTNAYAASIQSARALTNELLEAQRAEARGDVRGRTRELTAFMDEALGQVGSGLTADQAAVLQRLARWLLSPDPLANDTPDPKGSGVPYADLAFGGAGRDVLIGNTSSDRLIDWSDEFNTYAVPWNTNEGQGDNGNKRPLVDRYDDELAEFLVDLGLSAGADPTRGNVLRGGEPNGELGLVGPSDPAWAAQSGRERDEEIDVVRHSDRNSLGYRVVQSPSIRMEELDELRLDSTSEALLHRIAIRGRLTAAEESTLDLLGRSALGRLIAFGLVARSNGAVAVTDALLLATGYADPPRITSVSPPAATSTTTPVTVSGTGDAGDFVTLYDGSTAIGTATVRADGTWSLTVSLAVGVVLGLAEGVTGQPDQGRELLLHAVVDIALDAPALLLLGVHDAAGKLRYAGNVGTGFTQATLTELRKKLGELAVEKSPFEGGPQRVGTVRLVVPHWVKPKLVAEVAFDQQFE